MTRLLRRKENSTLMQKKEEVGRNWIILDASGKTLGRFASEVARVLRGKHKPTFTPHTDGGDGVIVINANKIRVTGAKEAQKLYTYHTGYTSGLRQIPYRTMLDRKPEYIIEHAVKGMMPRTKQGRAQMKRLRIFSGNDHSHSAQQPIKVNI